MFGIKIIDPGFSAMFAALMAGFAPFLSPCVLPIAPPYLVYMSGISLGDLSDKEKPTGKAFMPGFSYWLLEKRPVLATLG